MFCTQPEFRVHKLRRITNAKKVPLSTALSLRRHHMKRLNPHIGGMQQLRLGSNDDIRESARLFEEAVEHFLRRQRVEFYSEQEQKAHVRKHRGPGAPYPPTPDFILKRPIRIKQFVLSGRRKGERGRRTILQERSVCWIEVKMFYGASTIEPDGNSAVGCLMNTARKYVRVHGQGAMVFMNGYGDRLAQQLAEVGVMALDCSCRDSISLDRVQEHQRTWCADKNGNILP